MKKTFVKRLTSLILSFALVCTMSMMAFAATQTFYLTDASGKVHQFDAQALYNKNNTGLRNKFTSVFEEAVIKNGIVIEDFTNNTTKTFGYDGTSGVPYNTQLAGAAVSTPNVDVEYDGNGNPVTPGETGTPAAGIDFTWDETTFTLNTTKTIEYSEDNGVSWNSLSNSMKSFSKKAAEYDVLVRFAGGTETAKAGTVLAEAGEVTFDIVVSSVTVVDNTTLKVVLSAATESKLSATTDFQLKDKSAGVKTISGVSNPALDNKTYILTVGSLSDDTGYTVAVKIDGSYTAAKSFDVELTPPVVKNFNLDSTGKIATIIFNKNIALNVTEDVLRANVKWQSTDPSSSAGNTALAVRDTVSISGDTMTVTFDAALSGLTNYITIAANTLKDTYGNVASGIIKAGPFQKGENAPVITAEIVSAAVYPLAVGDLKISINGSDNSDWRSKVDSVNFFKAGNSTNVPDKTVSSANIMKSEIGYIYVHKASLPAGLEGEYKIVVKTSSVYNDASTTAADLAIDNTPPIINADTTKTTINNKELDNTASNNTVLKSEAVIVITFNEPVYASDEKDAFTTENVAKSAEAFVINANTPANLNLSGVTISSDANAKTVTINLTNVTKLDGDTYSLAVDMTKIFDAAGNAGSGTTNYAFTVGVGSVPITAVQAVSASTGVSKGDLVISFTDDDSNALRGKVTSVIIKKADGTPVKTITGIGLTKTQAGKIIVTKANLGDSLEATDYIVEMAATGYVNSIALGVAIDTKPPTVASSKINGKALTDSATSDTTVLKSEATIVLTFSEAVYVSAEKAAFSSADIVQIDGDAFKLVASTPSNLNIAGVTLATNPTAKTVTIDLTGVNRINPDTYTLTIDKSKVFDATGNAMGADTVEYEFIISGSAPESVTARIATASVSGEESIGDLVISFTDDAAWRGAVNGIKLYKSTDLSAQVGSTITSITKDKAGKLIVTAANLAGASTTLDGNYKIVITATNYKDVSTAAADVVIGNVKPNYDSANATVKGVIINGELQAGGTVEFKFNKQLDSSKFAINKAQIAALSNGLNFTVDDAASVTESIVNGKTVYTLTVLPGKTLDLASKNVQFAQANVVDLFGTTAAGNVTINTGITVLTAPGIASPITDAVVGTSKSVTLNAGVTDGVAVIGVKKAGANVTLTELEAGIPVKAASGTVATNNITLTSEGTWYLVAKKTTTDLVEYSTTSSNTIKDKKTVANEDAAKVGTGVSTASASGGDMDVALTGGSSTSGSLAVKSVSINGVNTDVTDFVVAYNKVTIPTAALVEAAATGDVVINFTSTVASVESNEVTITIPSATAFNSSIVALRADSAAIKGAVLSIEMSSASSAAITAADITGSPTGLTSTITGGGLTVAVSGDIQSTGKLDSNLVVSISGGKLQLAGNASDTTAAAGAQNVEFTGTLANNSYEYEITFVVAVSTAAGA